MKTLILACSLLLVLCTASSYVDESIPLFVWSSNQIFSQHNEQTLQTLTDQDIEESLEALLLNGGRGETFIKDIQGSPEAVIIFVEPMLHTNQIPHFGSAYSTSPNGGAFQSLKNIIGSSKASLVAPYVTSSSQYSLVDSLLARVAGRMTLGSILIVTDAGSSFLHSLKGQTGVQTTTTSEFKSHSSLFTNGVADLIVVCLSTADSAEKFQAHDQLIGSLSQMVSTATSGNFVGMYTGNSITGYDTIRTFEDPNAHLFRPHYLVDRYWESVLDATSNTTNTTVPRTYLTGPILEAFMVIISLVTMVFVGMCNLCRLQVPETYEAPKPQTKIM